jgi:hypothetical protein
MKALTPEDLIWQRAFAALVRIATVWRRLGAADPQDLAQQALLQVFQASAGPPTDANKLVKEAAPIMKGLYLNKWRANKRRERQNWMADAARYTVPERATPEGLAAEKDYKERCLARLKRDLRDDPLGLAIVQATLDGNETAAEQVEALGKDLRTIRNARKRVFRAADAIADANDETGTPEWTVEDGVNAPEDRVDHSEYGQEAEEKE